MVSDDESDTISVFTDIPEEISPDSDYAKKLLEDEIIRGSGFSNGKFRISERTLLTLAAVGGAWGAYAAMQLFRHKTRHKKFAVGVPLMLAAQTAVYIWVFKGL